jgi:DNA primase
LARWIDDLVSVAHARLMVDRRAQAELYGRGVSDDQMRLFQVGCLGATLPPLPEDAEPFSKWHAGALGVDTFVFPLTTPRGVVQGLQLRARAHKVYQDYFLPGVTDPVLFGFPQAVQAMWATEAAWLVEGVFDCFPIQRHFPAVLPLLTDRVTPSVLRVLRRLVKRVWVGFDADSPGMRGAYTFKREHSRDFRVDVVVYPRIPLPGSSKLTKDPGDLWEVQGEEAIANLVRRVTSDYMEFQYAQAVR